MCNLQVKTFISRFLAFSVLFLHLEMFVFTCELDICAHFHMCINLSTFLRVLCFVLTHGKLGAHLEMCNSHVKTYISHDLESSLFCFHIKKCMPSHVNCTFVHMCTCASTCPQVFMCSLFCFYMWKFACIFTCGSKFTNFFVCFLFCFYKNKK